MSDPRDLPADEEEELLRRAEAIADDMPNAAADRASSPLLRRMSLIGEAAAAFRDTAPDAEAADGGALFSWGPLQARRLLGEGSFGEVYAAWDPRLHREMALKLRRPDAGGSSRRWLDEARSLARVRHPNVLTVHGADEHDGRVGLWTDLVRGRDLEAVLQQHGPFSARETAAVGLDLCAALSAVHARGLVHGDVKTRNVMRDESDDSPGRIVLMDFGSAHEASLAMTAGRGNSIGTPLAMAPEVLRGEAATVASDVYSLGVLLFRLATNRYPVEAATLDELQRKHAAGEIASLRSLRPDLPRAFVQAVERALDPDPRRRFADAAAMERALQILPSSRVSAPLALGIPLGVAAVLLAAWVLGTLRTPQPERTRVPPETSAQERPAPGPPFMGPAPASPAPVGTSSVQVPGLRAEATLYRVRAGEVMPLASGGEIEPGDRLYLSCNASEAVHAYVLDEDGAGRVTVLFPCTGTAARNPLNSGASHRLPGAHEGRELNWLVTSAEGRETFLLVLGRHALAPLEEAVAALPQASESSGPQYASLGEDDLRRLRGVTRMVPAPARAPESEPGRLGELARTLGARADAADLWVRLVQVDNPKN